MRFRAMMESCMGLRTGTGVLRAGSSISCITACEKPPGGEWRPPGGFSYAVRSVPLHVSQKRVLPPHRLDARRVHLHDEGPLGGVGVAREERRLAPRVVGRGAAAVVEAPAAADAVDGDDPALVLDRARAHERVPVRL